MTEEEHQCQFGLEYRGERGQSCCFLALHIDEDGGEHWFPLWWTPQRGADALDGLGISSDADPEWYAAPELAEAISVPRWLVFSQTADLVRWSVSEDRSRIEVARSFGEPYVGLLDWMRQDPETDEFLPRHEMAGEELRALVRKGFTVAEATVTHEGDFERFEIDPKWPARSEYEATTEEIAHFLLLIRAAVGRYIFQYTGLAGLLRLALGGPDKYRPGTRCSWWGPWVKIFEREAPPLAVQRNRNSEFEEIPEEDFPMDLSIWQGNHYGWGKENDKLAATAVFKSPFPIWNPATGLKEEIHCLPVYGRVRYQEEIFRDPARGEQLPLEEDDLPSEVKVMVKWLREEVEKASE